MDGTEPESIIRDVGQSEFKKITAFIDGMSCIFGGDGVIPRIKSVKPLKGYLLHVIFDDGKDCIYNVKDDIDTIRSYKDLETITGLFEQVQLDESRTCVFWNDYIDLPSDTIYENAMPEADEIEAIERVNKSIAKNGTVPHDANNWG